MPKDTRAGEPLAFERARLERAASRLTRLERDVLLLGAGRNLSLKAIAHRLGIRERRAERLLARAVRKFDRALDLSQRSRTGRRMRCLRCLRRAIWWIFGAVAAFHTRRAERSRQRGDRGIGS
jgi:DNA-binding CsgD family transcriptional regulator